MTLPPITTPLARTAFIGGPDRSGPDPANGSALLMVLVVLSLLLVFSTIVATLATRQHRFLQGDIDLVNARYDAESGISVAMAILAADPSWRSEDRGVRLSGGGEAHVSIRPLGAFFDVRSTATVRRRTSGVRAIVGSRDPLLRYALVLGDVATPLHVAGSTTLDGPLLLGPRRLRPGTLSGIPWRGTVNGPQLAGGERPLPDFNAAHLEAELTWLDDALDSPSAGATSIRARQILPGAEVLLGEGNARLTRADSDRWETPVVVLIAGDLELDDGFSVPVGTRVAATGAVHIGGGVGRHAGIVYGRRHVVLSGARVSGQFLARDSVVVRDGTYLTYPSVLYVTGRHFGAERHASIMLAGRSTLDGSLIYPSIGDDAIQERGRVTIGTDALVRGAIYSAGQTDLQGTVYGSVFTHQFYHFASPQTFVNWLIDAVVIHSNRPAHFIMPVGMGGDFRPAILDSEPFGTGSTERTHFDRS